MKEINVSEYTQKRLETATEFEVQKDIFLTLRKTEIRIAEATQHLKVIKIILLIFFIAAVASAIIGLFFLSKGTSYNSFYIK